MIKRSTITRVFSVAFLSIIVGGVVAAAPVSAATQSVTVPYVYNASGDFEVAPGVNASAIGQRFANTTPPYASDQVAQPLEFATFDLNVPTICDGATISALRLASTTTSTLEESNGGSADDFVAISLLDAGTGDPIAPDTIVVSGNPSAGLMRGTGTNSGSTTIAGQLEGVYDVPFTSDGEYMFALIHDSNDGSTFETTFTITAEYDDADCVSTPSGGSSGGATTASAESADADTLASSGHDNRAAIGFGMALIMSGALLIVVRRQKSATLFR